MFNVLTGLAMGIVIFAITIGVGTVVLTKFGGSIAECPAVGESVYEWNATANQCINTSDESDGAYDPTNAGWASTDSLITELGTTGLAGWTAAIIALAVGLIFIGALMGKRKY